MSSKFALIIGNTEYNDSGLAQLTAPGRDVEDFARVLKDLEVCAFDYVSVLLNRTEPVVREAIDVFFDQKKPDDLLVLYFSGHGVRDELGALYLAVKNTNRYRLRSTAVKSDFIREAMDQSRSKRQVLILDCCNSGAFSQGTKAATGVSIGTATAFEAGYGRIILTASDSTQFAWEGDKVIGETDNSLFTHFLVKGLEGEADRDGDGCITVDELYDYAYEKVKLATPKQTPSKFSTKQQGEIILRHIRPENIRPVSLPTALLDSLENPFTDVRLGAVQQLTKLLNGKNLALAHSARKALEGIAEKDDSRRVSVAAMQVLESVREPKQLVVQKVEPQATEERADLLKAQSERAEFATQETSDKSEERVDAKQIVEKQQALEGRERVHRSGDERLVLAKPKLEAVAQKAGSKATETQTARFDENQFVYKRNILRNASFVLMGAILIGIGDWVRFPSAGQLDYDFFAWVPSLLSILFGPFVGGLSAAFGNLLFQLLIPLKAADVPFFIDQRSMLSGFVAGILPGLMVKDAKKWNDVVFAGLISLSTIYLISIWSVLNAQIFGMNEWFDLSLADITISFLTNAVPSLIILLLLARLFTPVLSRMRWYYGDQKSEKTKSKYSPGRRAAIIALGWGVAWGLTVGLNAFMRIVDNVDIFISCGIFCGLISGYVFLQEFPLFRWYHLIILTLSWMIGMQISIPILGIILWNGPIPSLALIILGIGGGLGGLFSGFVVRWAGRRLTFQQILIIAAGWALGLIAGVLLPPVFIPWLQYGYEISQAVRFIVAGTVAGAIGGSVMFWQLQLSGKTGEI